MKTLLILFFSAQSLLAGDSVNNGGGLSEQSSIYSAQHMPQFIQSCMQYSYCGANESDRSKLLELLSCHRPKDTEIRFGNPTDEPFRDGTKLGLPYRRLDNGEFFINRAYLYPNDQPMLLPQTIGHLARLQLDNCNVIPFSSSAEIAKKISWVAEQEGEQITIGKEEIYLPPAKWIRVRTLLSDLIIEAPKSFLRLSCEGESLDKCSFVSVAQSSGAKFKDLSLQSETLEGKIVGFQMEGRFGATGNKKIFNLSAKYEDGFPKTIWLNGIEMPIPTADQ